MSSCRRVLWPSSIITEPSNSISVVKENRSVSVGQKSPEYTSCLIQPLGFMYTHRSSGVSTERVRHLMRMSWLSSPSSNSSAHVQAVTSSQKQMTLVFFLQYVALCKFAKFLTITKMLHFISMRSEKISKCHNTLTKWIINLTIRSAVAERPRDASCHWIFC